MDYITRPGLLPSSLEVWYESGYVRDPMDCQAA